MTIKYGNTTKGRLEVVEYLKLCNFKRVLDIGYSANGWTQPFVTHTLDIVAAPLKESPGIIQFFGDANESEVWDLIEQDVKQHGPFDFCIASHVLEDIVNPSYVAKKISQNCSAGFVAVPSKFIEFTRHIDGEYRGFIHHRYIFNIENNELVGYPKLNFIERDHRFDYISDGLDTDTREVQLWWTNQLQLKIVNNNYMGPNVESVLSYYDGLLK